MKSIKSLKTRCRTYVRRWRTSAEPRSRWSKTRKMPILTSWERITTRSTLTSRTITQRLPTQTWISSSSFKTPWMMLERKILRKTSRKWRRQSRTQRLSSHYTRPMLMSKGLRKRRRSTRKLRHNLIWLSSKSLILMLLARRSNGSMKLGFNSSSTFKRRRTRCLKSSTGWSMKFIRRQVLETWY